MLAALRSPSLLASLLALTACSGTPSVERLTEEHHDAIVAHVEQVRAVRDQLASAPSDAPGLGDVAGTLTLANTVVIAENDFGALRTDRQADFRDHYDWRDASSVRPRSSSDFAELVDAVRAIPSNPPRTDALQVEAMQRRVAGIAERRYVAVVRTDESTTSTAGGGRFTSAHWKGRLLVWELAAARWVGAITVEVDDRRVEVRSGSSDPAYDINWSFNQAIDNAVSQAVTAGRDVHTAR